MGNRLDLSSSTSNNEFSSIKNNDVLCVVKNYVFLKKVYMNILCFYLNAKISKKEKT